MRRKFLSILALGCCFIITACSSTQPYKISLRDGRELMSAGEPRFVQKTGYYRYRDQHGKDALVRADEVLTIQQM